MIILFANVVQFNFDFQKIYFETFSVPAIHF